MYFTGNELNEDSLRRIKNIENSIRNHPAYAEYDVENYLNDRGLGSRALELSKNGKRVNLFVFYPNREGKIHSIAIYGSNLAGHYNAMRRSMMCFDIKISDLSYEGDLVDVILDY